MRYSSNRNRRSRPGSERESSGSYGRRSRRDAYSTGYNNNDNDYRNDERQDESLNSGSTYHSRRNPNRGNYGYASQNNRSYGRGASSYDRDYGRDDYGRDYNMERDDYNYGRYGNDRRAYYRDNAYDENGYLNDDYNDVEAWEEDFENEYRHSGEGYDYDDDYAYAGGNNDIEAWEDDFENEYRRSTRGGSRRNGSISGDTRISGGYRESNRAPARRRMGYGDSGGNNYGQTGTHHVTSRRSAYPNGMDMGVTHSGHNRPYGGHNSDDYIRRKSARISRRRGARRGAYM